MKDNLKPVVNKKAKVNSRARLKQELMKEDWEHFTAAVEAADFSLRPVKPVRKFAYR